MPPRREMTRNFWKIANACQRILTRSLLVLLLVSRAAMPCGPGKRGISRRHPKNLTPLVLKQHVPNVPEQSVGASSLAEGRIARTDPRFRGLVPNYNDDIIFRDEEGTGADRVMTKRCLEKLNTLAVSVMNQWPGVRLRVIEGWDEDGHHYKNSLHYEGRAVDILTSDRDRAKYGLLARLAVEAGFDWVYYESRSHIHCSVKSDSMISSKHSGCFSADSFVTTKDGAKRISEVAVGEEVLAVNDHGKTEYSKVILILDSSQNETRTFVTIQTVKNKRISLTPGHLIYICPSDSFRNCSGDFEDVQRNLIVTFSLNVKVNDSLLVETDGKLALEKVTRTWANFKVGFHAPLTRKGSILVNNIAASCYAVVDNHRLAHWAFFPVRWYVAIWEIFGSWKQQPQSRQIWVHWYAQTLYRIAAFLLPEHLIYSI